MNTKAMKIRKHPKQRNPIALSGEAVLQAAAAVLVARHHRG